MNWDELRSILIEATKDKKEAVDRYVAISKAVEDSGIPCDQMSMDALIYIVMHNMYGRGATIEQIMWLFSGHISAFARAKAEKMASNN